MEQEASGVDKDAFLAWLKKKGVSLHPSIDLFHDFADTGRGAVALADLTEGELLVEIPPGAYMRPPGSDGDSLDKFLLAHRPAVICAYFH